MASEAVYNFFKEQNRPFSLNDVIQNKKDFSKSTLQKAIDDLISEDKLFEKSYGKQKVYCVTQDENVDPNQMNEDLKELDRAINEASSNLKVVEDQLNKHNETLAALRGQMSLETAREEYSKLTAEVEGFKEKLDKLGENKNVISESEKIQVYNEYDASVREYKKRRRMCLNIVDAIMENYPKSKKDLLQTIGLETDEDVGFKLD